MKKTKQYLSKSFIFSLAFLLAIGIVNVNPIVSEIEASGVVENVDSDKRETSFNQNWKFSLQEGFTDAKAESFDDNAWQNLSLPHDWSIFFDFDHSSPAQNEGGLLNGGTGWYRKKFVLDANTTDKRVRINFGGIYMDSTVYVNGKEVGNYPNGYTPFSYDITDFLHEQGVENTISIRVVNKQPSSRWYSGSGIYRDVSMSFTDETHIKEYGTYITTPHLADEVGGNVSVVIDTSLVANNKNVALQYHLLDGNKTVLQTYDVMSTQIVDGTQKRTETIQVNNPSLWDIDSPTMYHIQTDVIVDGKVVDSTVSRFGFRFMDWVADTGFSLNGKYIKFYGVSMHHDQGALGAVANYNAMHRQMRILKDMGVNAVRITHNPADDKLIEIAEDMGLLIIDEAFDTWYGGKKTYDYGRFFEKPATHPDASPNQTWAEFDIKQMVKRGQNSPAIIMWSVGNEIGESNGGSAKAVQTVRNLNKWVKDIDTTRYTTIGQDVYRWAATGAHEAISAEVDAVGINYAEDSYATIRAKHPDWLVYGSETSSATRSRGVYAFPDSIKSHDSSAARKYQQSDYGNDHVGWGKTATNAWIPDRDNQGYAGQFIWTGFDYIGEPTPWHNQNATPPKSSYFGIIDTAGFPKNDYFLYQSQWKSVETDPMVHLLPHWNWEDEALLDYNMRTHDGKIPMRVFSNAPSVELFLNGTSLGTKSFVQKTTNYGVSYQEGAKPSELYLEWRLTFETGELIAVAKDADGNEIARDVVTSSKGSNQVLLSPEKRVISADGNDLSYIEVSIVDENKVMNPNAQNNVRFKIAGDGVIVGVDNGDSASNERYKAQHDGTWQRKVFNGKALVIVQSTTREGKFTLTAEADNLNTHEVDIYSSKDMSGPSVILGYDNVYATTDVGIQPNLPETVKAIESDGNVKDVAVAWDTIDETTLSQGGNIIVEGSVEFSEIRVKAFINIREIEKVVNVRTSVAIGELPKLPNDVTLIYTNGSEISAPVVWDDFSETDFSEKGLVEIKGSVSYLNTNYDVVAFISVLEASIVQENIAIAPNPQSYPKVSATHTPGGDDAIYKINDGVIDANNRWTNWTSGGFAAKETESVIFEFENAEVIHSLGIHFFTDSATKTPQELLVYASLDGTTYEPVINQSKTNNFNTSGNDVGKEVAITFDTVNAKFIKLVLKARPNGSKFSPVGLSEVKVIADVKRIVADSDAQLTSLKVGEQAIDLVDNQFSYAIDLDYASRDSILYATAKEGAGLELIQPSNKNNYIGKIIVTSQDGVNRKVYSIRYNIEDPILDSVTLKTEVTKAKEDDSIAFTLEAMLENNSILEQKFYTVEYTVSPTTGLIVNGSQFDLYHKGSYDVSAVVTYFGQKVKSNTVTIEVEESTEIKTIKALKPVSITTALGVKPELPKTVTAVYETGFDRDLAVVWDTLEASQLDKYGSFTVKGKVEGTLIPAEVHITVEGIVATESFSTATALHKTPTLPERARGYRSDQSSDYYPIEWNPIEAEQINTEGTFILEGSLVGTNAKTSISIRVSADTKDGTNIAQMWTGSDLPAGIASFTNDGPGSNDRVSLINDTVISYEATPANRWTNWQSGGRGEDWVGILFADAGSITKRYVDNMNIGFFKDSGTDKPGSYVIEYFTPDEAPALPTQFGHIAKETNNALNNDANWTAVSNETAADLELKTMNEIKFDGVETYAIRIRMTPGTIKGLAITELQVMDRVVDLYSDIDMSLQVNGEVDPSIDLMASESHLKMRTHTMPTLTLETERNASYTLIPDVVDQKTIRVIIKAEDGIKIHETLIHLDYAIADALDVLETQINDALTLDLSLYTSDSQERLMQAITSAQAVHADGSLEIEAIVSASKTFSTVLDSLMTKGEQVTIERSVLARLIKEAQTYKLEDYETISADALAQAIEEAQSRLEDATSSLDAIKQAQIGLVSAIENLVIKPDVPVLPEGITATFMETLEKARAIIKQDYTEASFEVFAKALQNAESLVLRMSENGQTRARKLPVSDKELIQSTKELNEAMAQLVKRAGTPGGETENPGTDNPGTDNPGTDNPGTDNPGTENPGTDRPETGEPGTDSGTTPPQVDVESGTPSVQEGLVNTGVATNNTLLVFAIGLISFGFMIVMKKRKEN